jgi:fibro-slime domain-containing protein
MKPIKTFMAAIAALGISYTWAETVKEFHVFVPNSRAWNSSVPMISEDGKSRKLTMDTEHCGWYYRRYVDEAIPEKVFIYRDDDATMSEAIGMNGSWESSDKAQPISLDLIFDLYATDPQFNNAIYFVADAEEADKFPSGNMGWFAAQPNITGNCRFNLATIIYDTDASLHPSFSCWAEGVSTTSDGCQAPGTTAAQEVNKTTALKAIYDCMGVTTGIVESTLDPTTKKPKLTTAGKKCFIDETYFNQLFNITSNVNEASCFDIPFTRSNNGWEFNSDNFVSPGLSVPVRGGFYPVEAKTDATILATSPAQTPLTAARTKRFAEGPVFYGPALRINDSTTQIPKIDTYCNGPGWTGGYNCEGLFADGATTAEAIQANLRLGPGACVFGWSCDEKASAPEGWNFYAYNSENAGTETSRWTSNNGASGNGGRNMHFCSETHSTFSFKKGMTFSISGSDDIWVYIDNKLAVDLGGTHLSAPGLVDMDKFLPNAEIGKSYDIDIFTCNRRATSSDLRINANFAFFAEETSGISVRSKFDTEDYIKNGNNHMKICYKSAGGSCLYALGGSSEDCETATIETTINDKIKYIFTTDKTGSDSTKIIINEAEFAKNPVQANGGIDITDRAKPIVNQDKLNAVLPPGKYYLIVKIGKYSHAIEIVIKGSVAVANREAVTIDNDGKPSAPSKFKSMATPSTPLADGSPDINQLVPLYIAAIIDPCSSTNCTDPLELQHASGAAYSLQVSNNKAVFYEKKNGKLVAFNPASSRKIGEGGIDTIYVTIPSDEMVSQEEKVSINVKGSARKAEINFFVPKLVFVDSYTTYNIVTKDKDTDSRIKGGIYAFNVIALNADNTPCTDCNFKLSLGSKTSSGLTILSDALVRFGRAVFEVSSSLVYKKGTEASCNGPATLQVVGPNPALMQVSYSNLQFEEPPMSIPQLEAVKKSTFSVQTVAPLEISITTSNFTKNGTKSFAVMDMKGQVISTGSLNSSSTRVTVPVSGSYIVKVGTNSKRVNVR